MWSHSLSASLADWKECFFVLGSDIYCPLVLKKQLDAGIAVRRITTSYRGLQRLVRCSYHRSIKNRVFLKKCFLPGRLELSVQQFDGRHNNETAACGKLSDVRAKRFPDRSTLKSESQSSKLCGWGTRSLTFLGGRKLARSGPDSPDFRTRVGQWQKGVWRCLTSRSSGPLGLCRSIDRKIVNLCVAYCAWSVCIRPQGR